MNIVTVGGGSGTPVINEALLLAGVKNITSIVTVMDSGGITGRMRSDSKGEEVAYSDGLRTLLSLVDPKIRNSFKIKTLFELLRKRNAKNEDLGYTIFSHYFDKDKGFGKIKAIFEQLTDLKFCGEVLPITTGSTNLVFETSTGQIFYGEHELDDKRMSADMVKNIWLDPQVAAYGPTLTAIRNADVIFFCCGSLHGSILANLLPGGVAEALRQSRAKKILLTNLASGRNETHDFTIPDFIRLFAKYSQNPRPLDLVIVPNISRGDFERKYPEVSARYRMEHSHFLGWEKTELARQATELGIQIKTHAATTIDPKKFRLRHDPSKLSKTLKALI